MDPFPIPELPFTSDVLPIATGSYGVPGKIGELFFPGLDPGFNEYSPVWRTARLFLRHQAHSGRIYFNKN